MDNPKPRLVFECFKNYRSYRIVLKPNLYTTGNQQWSPTLQENEDPKATWDDICLEKHIATDTLTNEPVWVKCDTEEDIKNILSELIFHYCETQWPDFPVRKKQPQIDISAIPRNK